MKIAFYSPLKPANHAVPSGDRLMAQMLIKCLKCAGHNVEIVSYLRAFLKKPDDHAGYERLKAKAENEIERLREDWSQNEPPDMWFCYHPYYKSPDLIGPLLCSEFGLSYVTAEASYSDRRNKGAWIELQSRVLGAINQASVNICMTKRDLCGLQEAEPKAQFSLLRPFVDTDVYTSITPEPRPFHIVCVAMMRPGDKMESYNRLAAALALMPDLPWRLSIVGDGPCRETLWKTFARFPKERLIWHGQKSPDEIATIFSQSSVYAWPGCGEAYGLAYLEAQAAGLPVVAYDTAGVPEVVKAAHTGLLTPPDNDAAYAAALRHLLTDEVARKRMADDARSNTISKHSIRAATNRLETIIGQTVGNQ